METRGLKNKTKSKVGFGTPSRTESQPTSSRNKPSGATASTEVGTPISLYGDYEGLEHPQNLETNNSEEQVIQYSNTGNLGEQLTSGVQVNSEFQEQIAETSDQGARRHVARNQITRREEITGACVASSGKRKKGQRKTSLGG